QRRPAGTAAPVCASDRELEPERGIRAGTTFGYKDEQRGARARGGARETRPRDAKVGGGFGQVEDDQTEAACAEEVLGGFGGVVLGSGSDPEHARGGDSGGDEGFWIERV